MAVFATARKLAVLIYRLLRWGQQYVDEGAEAFENRYQEIRRIALKARTKELGYELVQSIVAWPRWIEPETVVEPGAVV